jgi:malate dehydrogenase
MREIAVIGAGELGGAVAHAIAHRDLAHVVTIIDDSSERGQVAAGKALDIAQAAPIEGFATQLSGSTDLAAAAGAEVVVIADRSYGGEWQGDSALSLMRRVQQMAPAAIVLCAGAGGRELVDRGALELKIPRARLIGSAPEALAGAAKAMIALALNGSARDVAVCVLGIPPTQTVIPWEDATAGGFALTRQLSEPARRGLEQTIAALWPLGPYVLAAAAARIVAAIDGRSRQRASCFVAPDLSAGARTRTAAMPVRLGPSGVAEVVVPALSVVERVALDNAVLL